MIAIAIFISCIIVCNCKLVNTLFKKFLGAPDLMRLIYYIFNFRINLKKSGTLRPQIILIILFFIFLLIRYIVDILTCIISAHSSRERSSFLRKNSSSSCRVKFAFFMIQSISFFVKSGTLIIDTVLIFQFHKVFIEKFIPLFLLG